MAEGVVLDRLEGPRQANGGTEAEAAPGQAGSQSRPYQAKVILTGAGERSPQRRLGAREAVGTPGAGVEVARTAGGESAGSTPRRPGLAGPPSLTGSHGAASPLHATPRSPNAPGLQTFGNKYVPFAAGFNCMADSAPVYRSARLHAVNPTAALAEDMSYYWTLDSGRMPPAAEAANPESHHEHVRNTALGTHGGPGGTMKYLWQPIR